MTAPQPVVRSSWEADLLNPPDETNRMVEGSQRWHVCSCNGAPYREVNSKVATTLKLKVEDKDRVNNL